MRISTSLLILIHSLIVCFFPVSGISQESKPTSASRPEIKAPREIEIHGEVVAIDVDGKENAEESGQMTVWVTFERSGKAHTVAVSGGKWTLTVLSDRTLKFDGLMLGGRMALVENAKSFWESTPIPPDGVMTVRARWLPKTTFRIVDGATGAELKDVDIVTGRDYPPDNTMHPTGQRNGTETIRRQASSPVVVPWTHSSQTKLRYWVRAPGYAWETFEFEHSVGGIHEVRLVPSSKSILQFIGKPPKDAVVRVYQPGGRVGRFGGMRGTPEEPQNKFHRRKKDQDPEAQVSCAQKDSLQIDGLKPGRYIVAVEVGETHRMPFVLADCYVDLKANESNPIEMKIESMPESKPTTMSGVLVLPPNIAIDDVRLVIEQIDAIDSDNEKEEQLFLHDMKAIDGKPREYTWEIDELPPGEYSILVEPFSIKQKVELVQSGLSDLRIEVTIPSHVVVRIVDDATGAAIEVPDFTWVPTRELDSLSFESHVGGIEHKTVKHDSKLKAYVFDCCLSRVSIGASAEGYNPVHNKVFDLVPGTNELTLRLMRATGVRVRAIDRSTRKPISDGDGFDIFASVSPIDHDGIEGSTTWSGETTLVYVSGPGRYRVRLEAPEGYKKPKNKIVNIEAGKILDITFELDKRDIEKK